MESWRVLDAQVRGPPELVRERHDYWGGLQGLRRSTAQSPWTKCCLQGAVVYEYWGYFLFSVSKLICRLGDWFTSLTGVIHLFTCVSMNVRCSNYHVFSHLCGPSVLGSWLVGWLVNRTILEILLKQPRPMEPAEFRDFSSSLGSLHPFLLTVHLLLYISAW